LNAVDSLREKQAVFIRALASLIVEAERKGIFVFVNELYRSKERQEQLYREGKSKTLQSAHLDGLAADLIVLREGKPVLENCIEYQTLGQMWSAMGGIWGGHFKSIHDIYHFEYSERLKEKETQA
jgi:peptidoglycan L-alanyl-D-glutamate endopeptidase CwlK